MTTTIRSIRGMHDIAPEVAQCYQALQDCVQTVLAQFGYQPMVLPCVEQTALFSRSVGEITDIVEKEMYTFTDRNGESLSLRPEGTAGCVRAMIEHGLLHNQTQRIWYSGPMFRHERPQKGRYRQFFQLGVEAFNLAGPDIDAELLQIQQTIWQRLGIAEHVTLQINTLGTLACREQYRQVLIKYFSQYEDQLDDDARRRLHTNPLRILDSKNPAVQPLIEAAPKLHQYLDDESRTYFEAVTRLLDRIGISYQVNQRLVRGLDYYCHEVYEWVTDALGAQGTVSAGGRYDGLVEKLGGKPTPACGFAMGIDRLVLLTGTIARLTPSQLDAYVIVQCESDIAYAMQVAQQLRQARPDWKVMLHMGGGSMKSQFKKADKQAAHYAVIIGQSEAQTQSLTIKHLRADSPQQTIGLSSLQEYLQQL